MKSSLQERRWLILLLIGGLVIVSGVLVGVIQAPQTYLSITFISLGASIAAAAVVMMFNPASEKLYEKLIALFEVNKKLLSLGIKEVYPSRDRVPREEWVRWLGKAKRRCILLGIAHGGWCDDNDLEPTLIDRLKRGVEINILFLDPTGEAARVRSSEEQASVFRPRDTRVTIKKSIDQIWKIRKNIEKEKPDLKGKLKVYVYNGTPSSGLMLVDDFMVVAHYLAAFPNVTSPTLLVERTIFAEEASELFDMYAENVERIKKWDSTIELTDENIGRYVEEENPTKRGGDDANKPK